MPVAPTQILDPWEYDMFQVFTITLKNRTSCQNNNILGTYCLVAAVCTILHILVKTNFTFILTFVSGIDSDITFLLTLNSELLLFTFISRLTYL